MNIKEFNDRFGSASHRSAEEICDKWGKEKEVDDLLGMKINSGVMVADLLIGDGSFDQVSPALKKSVEGLTNEKADSYSEIHHIFLDNLEKGDGSFLGMMIKIKGQIGEEVFRDICAKEGIKASLASSGSQEGWDVAVAQGDGGRRYVQVEMYGKANDVIAKIKEVQKKIKAGIILGEDGLPVTEIDFAVPSVIAQEITEKLEALNVDVGIISVNSAAMKNFFGELLGSVTTVTVLHAITNAFLVYKESKLSEVFLSDSPKSSSVAAAKLAAKMTVKIVLNHITSNGDSPTAALGLVAKLGARAIDNQLAKRSDAISWILRENNNLEAIITAVQTA